MSDPNDDKLRLGWGNKLKTCGRCGEKKPFTDFYRVKKRQHIFNEHRFKYCKACHKESRIESKQQNSASIGPLTTEQLNKKIGNRREKECRDCGEVKSLANGFHRNSMSFDGRSTYCKLCALVRTQTSLRKKLTQK
jgi:hypothetical protein